MVGYKLTKEDILYEDNYIIVCRKRAGIATQTARLGEPDLESALKNYWKIPYVAVIHRLDQPVEGILAFARTREAAAGLSRQSAGQVMNKKYYAVVMMGECGKENILVDYLQRNGRENTSRVVSKDARMRNAQNSLTKYWLRRTGFRVRQNRGKGERIQVLPKPAGKSGNESPCSGYSLKQEGTIRYGCRWLMPACRCWAIANTEARNQKTIAVEWV